MSELKTTPCVHCGTNLLQCGYCGADNPLAKSAKQYVDRIEELEAALSSIASNCTGVLREVKNQEMALEVCASVARAALTEQGWEK